MTVSYLCAATLSKTANNQMCISSLRWPVRKVLNVPHVDEMAHVIQRRMRKQNVLREGRLSELWRPDIGVKQWLLHWSSEGAANECLCRIRPKETRSFPRRIHKSELYSRRWACDERLESWALQMNIRKNRLKIDPKAPVCRGTNFQPFGLFSNSMRCIGFKIFSTWSHPTKGTRLTS